LDFEVNINPIHQRPADALLVALDHAHGTGALVAVVAVVAARAGVPAIYLLFCYGLWRRTGWFPARWWLDKYRVGEYPISSRLCSWQGPLVGRVDGSVLLVPIHGASTLLSFFSLAALSYGTSKTVWIALCQVHEGDTVWFSLVIPKIWVPREMCLGCWSEARLSAGRR